MADNDDNAIPQNRSWIDYSATHAQRVAADVAALLAGSFSRQEMFYSDDSSEAGSLPRRCLTMTHLWDNLKTRKTLLKLRKLPLPPENNNLKWTPQGLMIKLKTFWELRRTTMIFLWINDLMARKLSCQLLDSVTAESRFRYFWGVRAELRIFYGVLLLQHSPTNESTEAGSYVAFVELLPITEITAICSTSSD